MKNNRQTAISEAAVRLLGQKGMAGVTHRAVDAMAGLPQGSTTYYYPKKADLLRAAAEHLAQELEKDCDDLQIRFAETAAKDGLDAAIDLAAKGLIASAESGKELILARIELTMAAARDDALADVGARLYAAGRRPIEFFVKLISQDGSPIPVETCVGLIDGVALMYATGQGPQPTSDQIAAIVRAVLPPEK